MRARLLQSTPKDLNMMRVRCLDEFASLFSMPSDQSGLPGSSHRNERVVREEAGPNCSRALRKAVRMIFLGDFNESAPLSVASDRSSFLG